MLHGEFSILNDHKPLSFAIDRVSEPWSARQQRQLAFISEFTGDIKYLPGKENVVADSLSRPPMADGLAAALPPPLPHLWTSGRWRPLSSPVRTCRRPSPQRCCSSLKFKSETGSFGVTLQQVS
jgi:hypothetical protein